MDIFNCGCEYNANILFLVIFFDNIYSAPSLFRGSVHTVSKSVQCSQTRQYVKFAKDDQKIGEAFLQDFK